MKRDPGCLCPKCSGTDVIRYGYRYNQSENAKISYCNDCSSKYSRRTIKNITYPPSIILNSVSTFNLGFSIDETNKIINKRYGIKVPRSTIYSWIRKYENICTFTKKVRKNYRIDPKTIIQSKKLNHIQVYNYKYHTLMCENEL